MTARVASTRGPVPVENMCLLRSPAPRTARSAASRSFTHSFQPHQNHTVSLKHMRMSCSNPRVLSTASTAARENATEQVLQTWKSAEAVCFDVDSTVCVDECIDEIAAFLGVGEQVAALTANAMGGSVKFEDALAARLNLMQPSANHMADFIATHPPRLSPGIPELMKKLHESGKDVFFVSGGFRLCINEVAKLVDVPLDHVYANNILFNDDGSYAGFDPKEFTSRSGGKCEAVRQIKGKYGYKSMIMVGDGITDLEARQPGGANLFIGYGGAVVREAVAAGADWYVYSMQPLIEALD